MTSVMIDVSKYSALLSVLESEAEIHLL